MVYCVGGTDCTGTSSWSLSPSPHFIRLCIARLDRVGLLGNNYTAIRCSDHRDDRRTKQTGCNSVCACLWKWTHCHWQIRNVQEDVWVCVWPVNIFPSVSIIVNRASVSIGQERQTATKWQGANAHCASFIDSFSSGVGGRAHILAVQWITVMMHSACLCVCTYNTLDFSVHYLQGEEWRRQLEQTAICGSLFVWR